MTRSIHPRFSTQSRSRADLLSAVLIAALTLPAPAFDAIDRAGRTPEIDAGFRLLYEVKFTEARAQFASWEKAHPEDPLGAASEAASYLFEEFYAQGVFTSEFFLDDDRLLGGVARKADERRRAQELARRRLRSDPKDIDGLFALTISTGMQADYANMIEKRQFESLRLVREAAGYAKTLLALQPDSDDAYLALGAANYIIGCLPAYKRALLWFGGVRGDKAAGMRQLAKTAANGRYLRPFAKIMLALAALREKQVALARAHLVDLAREFPRNPLFAQELVKLNRLRAGAAAERR